MFLTYYLRICNKFNKFGHSSSSQQNMVGFTTSPNFLCKLAYNVAKPLSHQNNYFCEIGNR